MSRLDEIKNKYLGTYLLKENRNEDLIYLLFRVEKLEAAIKEATRFPKMSETFDTLLIRLENLRVAALRDVSEAESDSDSSAELCSEEMK